MKFERIVVGVDGSDNASRALECAIDVARAVDARGHARGQPNPLSYSTPSLCATAHCSGERPPASPARRLPFRSRPKVEQNMADWRTAQLQAMSPLRGALRDQPIHERHAHASRPQRGLRRLATRSEPSTGRRTQHLTKSQSGHFRM